MIPHRQIINAVLRKHGVIKKEFYSPARLAYVVEARREAARRLVEQGASPGLVGRVLHRDRSTVIYYLSPKMQARKRRRYEQARAAALQTAESGT